MTDKEFKRLTRAQLIDIIYQLQLKQDELTEENKNLKQELDDKRLKIKEAGSIADAALKINNCFRDAQKAADQYLDEIRLMRAEIDDERRRILNEAYEEATAIISQAKRSCEDTVPVAVPDEAEDGQENSVDG